MAAESLERKPNFKFDPTLECGERSLNGNGTTYRFQFGAFVCQIESVLKFQVAFQLYYPCRTQRLCGPRGRQGQQTGPSL